MVKFLVFLMFLANGRLILPMDNTSKTSDNYFHNCSKILSYTQMSEFVNLQKIIGSYLYNEWDFIREINEKTNGHKDEIWAVACAPDGKYFVSGSKDKTIKIWNFENKDYVYDLGGLAHNNAIAELRFSPDGKYLASTAKGEGIIKIWDFNSKLLFKTLAKAFSEDRAEMIRFSHDSKFIALASSNSLSIFDIETGKCKNRIYDAAGLDEGEIITSMAFSVDSKIIALGDSQGNIYIHDINTLSSNYALEWYKEGVNALEFSPLGDFLAAAYSSMIKIWDIKNKKCVASFGQDKSKHVDTDIFFSLKFYPDGRFLASGGYDKTIKIWDMQTFKCVDNLNVDKYVHLDLVHSIDFSPNIRYLVSVGCDKLIKVWQNRFFTLTFR